MARDKKNEAGFIFSEPGPHYQCKDPSVIVREYDQGASIGYRPKQKYRISVRNNQYVIPIYDPVSAISPCFPKLRGRR